MKPYIDHQVRVVSFEALDAMCEHISSPPCHVYRPVRVTKQYCYIEYSNPNEYGTPDPVTAVYPVYRQDICGQTMWCIVLDMVRIVNNDEGDTMWQAFECLRSCPTLHRDAVTGEWHTAAERVDDAAQRLIDLHDQPEDPNDPTIISWRASHIQDIALDALDRKLTDNEMEIIVHELDRLDFRSVEQTIEETIIIAVEKLMAEKKG